VQRYRHDDSAMHYQQGQLYMNALQSQWSLTHVSKLNRLSCPKIMYSHSVGPCASPYGSH